MNINVEFIGFPEFKYIIEKKGIEVDFSGVTFHDLIKYLDGRYRQDFRKAVLNEQGGVDSTVQVLRNDEMWIERDNLAMEIGNGDRIIFMRMMAGG